MSEPAGSPKAGWQASRMQAAAARGGLDAELSAEVRRRYDDDLGPHFAIEEEELLPALALVGRTELVGRTLREHGALRDHLAATESGDCSRLAEFGALLEAHVRFEERNLFTACEALIGPEVLARVALRAPKGKGPGYPKG